MIFAQDSPQVEAMTATSLKYIPMTSNPTRALRSSTRTVSFVRDLHSETIADDLTSSAGSQQKAKVDSKKRKQHNNRRLVVQGVIGTGGFGKVLAVTLQQTGKWYAAKEINKVDLMKHKSGHSMIFSELDAMSRVEQHPFLVSLHLAYHDRRNCYLVLDLKVGGDLRHYLKQKMIFEERDVVFYVACMSSALNHIHSRNMLHRDIKPENIILDERGWPHLADFGVAHVHTAKNSARFGGTLTCTLASGTKQYLAPEVFCKEHIHGPEADYWSLAVVAYELLHARRPFEKHCNISYITYLERSLQAKRAQIKKEQMYHLKYGRRLNVSFDAVECTSFAPILSNNSQRHTFCASPSQSSPKSVTFSASVTTSRESTASLPGISGGSRSNSIDESALGRDSPSSLAGSFGGSGGSIGYVSSAHVTPAVSPMAPRKSLAASGNTRPCAHCASCGVKTPCTHGNTAEMEQMLEAAAQLDVGRVRSTRVHSSQSVAVSPSQFVSSATSNFTNSGKSSDFASPSKPVGQLPQLCSPAQEAASVSTPQRILRIKPPLQELLAQAHQETEEKKFVGAGAGAYATVTAEDAASFQRVPYGDHWAVDDDPVLPGDLRVHIPQYNGWLGSLSPESVTFLKGMFDIRPSHRLSSRDIDAVRTHPWLRAHGLDNWVDLHQHRFNPNFKPGKRFMREVFAEQNNVMLMSAGNVLNDPDAAWTSENALEESRRKYHVEPDDSANGTGGVLTADQRESFRGFRYTSESFSALFQNLEAGPCGTRAAANVSH